MILIPFSASCEDKYFNDTVEDTMVINLDWTSRFSRSLSCICGLSILQTLSAVNVLDIAFGSNKSLCTQNGTISCSGACLGNETSLSCQKLTNHCDKCLIYGAMTHEILLQGTMVQIVALVDGIPCNTLTNYSRDICSSLFEVDNTDTEPTESNSNTSKLIDVPNLVGLFYLPFIQYNTYWYMA